MSSVVPFKKIHLEPLISQPINLFWLSGCFDNGLADLFEQSDAATVMYKGAVMGCGGVSLIWPGRGHLWCVFNEESRYNFVPTFRGIMAWLDSIKAKYNRLELSIDHGPFHNVACRRALALGFKLEIERARKYLPGGLDASLYSLVRD